MVAGGQKGESSCSKGKKKKTKRQNNAIPFTPTRPHQEKKRRGLTEYKENQ